MIVQEIKYDPEGSFLRLSHLRHPAFLDSARLHPHWGRISILGVDPILTLESRGSHSTLRSRQGISFPEGNPWEVLDGVLTRFHLPQSLFPPLPVPLPFGAAIGFLGYELGGWIERLPRPHPKLIDSPDLWFGFYDVLLVFDHAQQKGWILSTGLDENGSYSKTQAEFRRDQFQDEIQWDVRPLSHPLSHGHIQPVIPPEHYVRQVHQALRHIRNGDIYQVNLSHPYLGRLNQSAIDSYRHLRKINPAPFAAYLDGGHFQILSSSPERFLEMERRRVQTRPIKGTCARTGNPTQDLKESTSLQLSEKNRAELLMITDLMRNDLGRIAEMGSVRVPHLMQLEEYETVFHLVSTVEARLRPHILHLDTLAACFPGGSITGAPKISAMEMIHRLESHGRGPYTGSLGYIGFNGRSDFNILIRSIVMREQQACFHVGSGIVSDSDPLLEYEETLHKAQGLLRLWEETSPQSHVA